MIGLNNWDIYNTRDNTWITNEQQTNNKRITTTNKEYKEKKENKTRNNTTIVVEQAQESYGNSDINKTLTYISKAVWCTTFKESQAQQRIYWKHLFNLWKNIWIEEFNNRLKEILSDPFKAKNCNKLAYLYGELKSYIHSPVVEPQRRWLEV